MTKLLTMMNLGFMDQANYSKIGNIRILPLYSTIVLKKEEKKKSVVTSQM